MRKAIRIKLTDAAGTPYFWTVRAGKWHNCGGNLPRAKWITGWSYTDHEGYERIAEGNWLALVDAFRLTADNYGFTTNIS